jgi:hypothetical protein
MFRGWRIVSAEPEQLLTSWFVRAMQRAELPNSGLLPEQGTQIPSTAVSWRSDAGRPCKTLPVLLNGPVRSTRWAALAERDLPGSYCCPKASSRAELLFR